MATILKGARGADYAYPIKNAPSILRSLGYTFVIRYISVNQSNTKNITPVEAASILAAGLGLILVYEDSATDALRGAAEGKKDGERANVWASYLGYPRDCVILIAVDTDVWAQNVTACEAYVRAFDAACIWPTGVYGDRDILGRVQDICKVSWLPNATSWSANQTPSYVHVRQRGSRTEGGQSLDPNDVLRDFSGVWSAKAAAPPVVVAPPIIQVVPQPPVVAPAPKSTPIQGVSDMFIVRCPSYGSALIVPSLRADTTAGYQMHGISPQLHIDVLSAGLKVVDLPDAAFQDWSNRADK